VLVRLLWSSNGAAAACFGGLLLCCTDACAAAFSWAAPEVCPNQPEVAERIDAARGGPLADNAAVVFAADVSDDSAGKLTLTVRTQISGQREGAEQARTLTATDCEELVTAFVQMVSLAIGPYVAPESTEPNPEKGTVPAAAPPPAVADAPKARASAGSREDARAAPSVTQTETLRLSAFAVLDTGSLWIASVGVQLGVGVALAKAFELRGVLGYVPAHTFYAEWESPRAQGRFSLAWGGVLGCSVSSKGPFRGNFCGGMEVGSVSAAARGITTPKSDDVLWLAARGDMLLGVEVLRGLRVFALCGFAFPLLRHEFSLSGVPFHKIPGAVPRFGLGMEYGF
jgi:hypothetical protein